jgi:hypothetical protein
MGTNYYMMKGEWLPESNWDHPLSGLIREGTGRPASIHIGKSSGGWCFSLHVMPEQGISNLADWRALADRLLADGWRIEDEYRDVVTPDMMWKIVEREGWDWGAAEWRHEVDGDHCIGHGEGLYDYVVGYFS